MPETVRATHYWNAPGRTACELDTRGLDIDDDWKRVNCLNCLKHKPVNTGNPKDILGAQKVAVGLFPAAGTIYGALAFQDGAKKYGPYNWRDKKVKFSVYLDAIERHLLALRDGEDCAADSGLHHIAHIIASGGLIADAIEGGFLIDDRPPKGPAATTLEKFKKQ